jgi:3'(2'), 5'-bisphosphate nucleotidase
MFLGRHKLGDEEAVSKWEEIIDARRHLFASSHKVPETGLAAIPLGDGGDFQEELDTAIRAVQRASFLSRSLQHSLILSKKGKDDSNSLSKDDRSPVTIADYAVQAVIIDAVMSAFPEDKFIAEEDSDLLRKDEGITSTITGALNKAAVGDDKWTSDDLFATVDKGTFDGQAKRVWVLDPVDGTKGFLRGEHYCIALALLVDGKPVLSVLGCPNVELERSVNGIMEPQKASSILRGANISELHTHPSQAGSLFFAVSGMGAFARSLAMPAGAAVEVNVCSPLRQTGDAVLCESVEANHGDRRVTAEVFDSLDMSKEYVRLDGQCKYAIVGAGTAHGNMRLPPSGYIEKIWDHAPGAHFVSESGGTVTDLNGNPLDFSLGRFMDTAVTGIVASNHKKLQQSLLGAIAEAKKGEKKSDERVFMD